MSALLALLAIIVVTMDVVDRERVGGLQQIALADLNVFLEFRRWR